MSKLFRRLVDEVKAYIKLFFPDRGYRDEWRP
jgi:hypothetical protein